MKVTSAGPSIWTRSQLSVPFHQPKSPLLESSDYLRCRAPDIRPNLPDAVDVRTAGKSAIPAPPRDQRFTRTPRRGELAITRAGSRRLILCANSLVSHLVNVALLIMGRPRDYK